MRARPAPVPGALSDAQREQYREHGYLVIPGLFGAPQVEALLERFAALTSAACEAPAQMLVMRDVMIAKGAVAPRSPAEAIAKIQDFENDPVLYPGHSADPRLLDCIESLLGPDLKSVHTMAIQKPPRVDGRHPLHQDLLYFPFRPADAIVAAWTALDRCTRENGCLVAVPDSHRGPLLEHGNPDWEWLNLAYFGARGAGANTARVHLEMEPGDTVLFHPLLLHGSGRNRTDGFRRSISTHYASAHCAYLDGSQLVRPGSRPYRLVRGEAAAGGI